MWAISVVLFFSSGLDGERLPLAYIGTAIAVIPLALTKRAAIPSVWIKRLSLLVFLIWFAVALYASVVAYLLMFKGT